MSFSSYKRDKREIEENEEELERRLSDIRAKRAALKAAEVPIHQPVAELKESEYDPGDVIKREYRFIRTEDDDLEAEESWEKKIAKSYHDKLHKEYALADLSRYKEGKIGLRWRLDREVQARKGQDICGNKICSEIKGLVSYELPFKYIEATEEKLALVKVRVCPECAKKVLFKKQYQSIS